MVNGERWLFAVLVTAMAAIAALTLLTQDRDGIDHLGTTREALSASQSTVEPRPPTTSTSVIATRCHVSYLGGCVSPAAPTTACADAIASGKTLIVVGPDVYGLDPDGDRIAC